MEQKTKKYQEKEKDEKEVEVEEERCRETSSLHATIVDLQYSAVDVTQITFKRSLTSFTGHSTS